jgi:hypothetical protein
LNMTKYSDLFVFFIHECHSLAGASSKGSSHHAGVGPTKANVAVKDLWRDPRHHTACDLSCVYGTTIVVGA